MITVPAIRINPRKIATAANTTKLNPCLNLPVPEKMARVEIKHYIIYLANCNKEKPAVTRELLFFIY